MWKYSKGSYTLLNYFIICYKVIVHMHWGDTCRNRAEELYYWRNVSELSEYGNATFQYVFYGIRPKLQTTMSVIVAQQWVKKNIICLIIEHNLKI